MFQVSRVTWVTQVFTYMSLEDCMKVGQVSVFFNQLIKSPMFLKFWVKMSEKTKIDMSIDTFSNSASVFRGSKTIQSQHSIMTSTKQTTSSPLKQQSREDKEAELETLRQVKNFLTEKLKQNEGVIVILQKDISTLKQKLMIEMSINEKKGLALKAREGDLAELRTRHTDMETGLRKDINSMTLTLAERQRQVEGLA